MELTKSEFAESVVGIAREVIKQNVAESGLPNTEDPNSTQDADDLSLNGSTTDRPGVTKSEDDEVTKQIEALSETLAKQSEQLATVGDLVTKMAQRPRQGGPHLTGQLPEGLVPAGEGRQGAEVAKSESEQKIETLKKALEDAKARGDVQAADHLGWQASLEALQSFERAQHGTA